MSKLTLSCRESSWLSGICEEFLQIGRDHDFRWSLSSDDIQYSCSILYKLKSRKVKDDE